MTFPLSTPVTIHQVHPLAPPSVSSGSPVDTLVMIRLYPHSSSSMLPITYGVKFRLLCLVFEASEAWP